MRAFGSECFAYKYDKKELDTREKGVFVGYDKNSPAFLVFYPNTGKVMKNRLVKFVTKRANECDTQTDEDMYDIFEHRNRAEIQRSKPDVTSVIPQEVKLEVCQSNTNLQSIDESSHSARYPKRERKPPQYYTDCDYEVKSEEDQSLTNIDYCYRLTCDVLLTLQEALSSSKSEQWAKAMKEEMDSLIENDTFILTPLPESKHAVGGRWVYTVKESPVETIYKARYVAKGYSQVAGIDYNETFSPTADMTSVRVLMQLAAQYDLELHQMDVKTAYLHAPIDCEIYMEQPEGFEKKSKTGEKLVCKLNKSLYGLKQSGRNWNNRFPD